MTAMTAAEFEARYRAELDPWHYLDSPYERTKYEATLRACGDRRFASALELGASIGVFSAMLAPRCVRLVAIDFSPTAARSARECLSAYPHAQVIVGSIPDRVPDERFELVVASEILYYLTEPALARTLLLLERVLVPGGRLVCVHWRRPGPERPLDAAAVHATVAAEPWLAPVSADSTDSYLLDVYEHA